MNDNNNIIKTGLYPLLPMRGLSVFPGMLVNIDVVRPGSKASLEVAMQTDQLLFVVAQKDISIQYPKAEDFYKIGTLCRIKQFLRVPGSDTLRIMIEGISRARSNSISSNDDYLNADVEIVETIEQKQSIRTEAIMRRCVTLMDDYAHASGYISPEMLAKIASSGDPEYISDFIAQNIYFRPQQKQMLLEDLNPIHRIQSLNKIISHEISVIKYEKELSERTHEHMAESQKEFYLREQLKLIKSELNEGNETYDDLAEYRSRIVALKLSDEITEKLLKELARLSKQPSGSSESAVIRTYLDTVLDLPWNIKTKEKIDLKKARKILDEDHFGLEKVKERIIEYLAVKKLVPNLKGTVLCLVGPPGTGKTSIAMSISRATNRKLARISLGGVHDEAEIRGHRKTYIGAMPGRIISGIIQAKSSNPVMLMDEIDKLGSDYRGDPSAALLETLDVEQNNEFRDHYLEIPFDLSDTLFVTTANSLDTIPRALLDRMEIIQLSSYTDEEKLQIAKRHLLPKQRKLHGLTGVQLRMSDDAIRELITSYTRESGVRILEREIATVCRKAARKIADGECKSLRLKAGKLEKLLGPIKYKPEKLSPVDEIGLVRGLAWTAVGGTVLDVEVNVLDGSGELVLTGNLGDVMKESAKAAVSYIRSRAYSLGIDPEFYKKKDIHIHFPEGAIPKDGPSAGITICIAVISALTGVPVRRDVAMTGEISLRGRVMPIGGLREKTMAAMRSGIKTVIIPSDNERDLDDIDQTVRASLNFVSTDHVDKILDVALNRNLSYGTDEAKQSEGIIVPTMNRSSSTISTNLPQ